MSKIDEYNRLKRGTKFLDADMNESTNHECIYDGIERSRYTFLISIPSYATPEQGCELGNYLAMAIRSNMEMLLEKAAKIASRDLNIAKESALIEAREFIEEFNKNENTN